MRFAQLAERDGHFASPVPRAARSPYRLLGCLLHGTSSTEPMRLQATRESCDQGEITVLAIIETVLAVALLVFLSIWFDTTHWLAGACLLSPLLLLRTEDSVRLALRLKKWVEVDDRGIKIRIAIGMPVALLAGVWIIPPSNLVYAAIYCIGAYAAMSVFPIFFIARCYAALISIVRHPLTSVAAIPGNWRRIVLATDSFLEPEYVPGDTDGPSGELRYLKFVSPPVRFLFLLNFVILYPLTAAYRVSVKATCFVYLPLVWLVNKARYRADSTQHMLSDYLADEIQTVRRWALGLTSSSLIVKIIVLLRVDELIAAVKAGVPEWGLKILRTLHPYLTPRHIELWQLTPVLNGLLAVGMWLYARRMLRLGERAPAANTIQFWWNVMSCITLAFSLYSIACLLKITWDHGDLWGTLRSISEAIEWRFFPQATKP
jgi:hypothetical protein